MVFALNAAFALLCLAVALGAGLAIHFMRGSTVPRRWPAIAIGHGALGAAGLALLILGVCRGLPQSAAGTAGFGPAAAMLLAVAFIVGLALALLRRRPPGVLIAIHAGLAVAGFVVLWTLVSLG